MELAEKNLWENIARQTEEMLLLNERIGKVEKDSFPPDKFIPPQTIIRVKRNGEMTPLPPHTKERKKTASTPRRKRAK